MNTGLGDRLAFLRFNAKKKLQSTAKRFGLYYSFIFLFILIVTDVFTIMCSFHSPFLVMAGSLEGVHH